VTAMLEAEQVGVERFDDAGDGHQHHWRINHATYLSSGFR
jgi:hypothetical protein